MQRALEAYVTVGRYQATCVARARYTASGGMPWVQAIGTLLARRTG